MPKLKHSHSYKLALVTAALVAAHVPAGAIGFGNQLLQMTGVPVLQKIGNEGDNASADIKKAVPLVAAAATIVGVPAVGLFVAAKDQPKETATLGLVAISLAVACTDGCAIGMSGLAGLGGSTVAIPILESSNALEVPDQALSTSAGPSTPMSQPSLSRADSNRSAGGRQGLAADRLRLMPSYSYDFANLGSTDTSVWAMSADRSVKPGSGKRRAPNPPYRPVDGLASIAPSISYSDKQQAKVGPYLTTYYPPSKGNSGASYKDPNDVVLVHPELAGSAYETSPSEIAKPSAVGANLGDPWFKVTPQFSIQAGHPWLQMLKWNAHGGPIQISDFTIDVPLMGASSVLSVATSFGTSGLRSVSVIAQDPTGLFAAFSVGSSFGGGVPNVTFEARVFNLSGGITVEPGPGTYNAIGQLEGAVLQLYPTSPIGGSYQ